MKVLLVAGVLAVTLVLGLLAFTAADAKLDIQQALARAAVSNTPVIVVFGADWCADCRALDKAMKTGAVAPLIARDFQVVKVNIGKYDRNLDVAKSYGVPLEKGVPAVVLLSSKNEVLYATRDGELANAEKMGDQGIYDFFKKVTSPSALKPGEPAEPKSVEILPTL